MQGFGQHEPLNLARSSQQLLVKIHLSGPPFIVNTADGASKFASNYTHAAA
jgi:hypothetical protein